MELSQGNGGWFCLEDVDDFPGPLYFRLEDVDGRARITELYADGRGRPLSAGGFRSLPLRQLEEWASDFPNPSRRNLPGPDLSRLASHFASMFVGSMPQNWVADSMRAQVEGSGVEQPARGRRPGGEAPTEEPVRLDPPTGGRLTDDFLEDVARAYRAALSQGLSPGRAIVDACDVDPPLSIRTVQRWFAVARQRGFLPPASGPGRLA